MTATTYDINIDQGSDYLLEITVKDEADQVVDLTNYNARGQIRPKRDSELLTASFLCTVTSAILGKIQVSLVNAVSKTIPAGTYYYDIEIFTAGDAYVKRILQGKVKIIQEVTR